MSDSSTGLWARGWRRLMGLPRIVARRIGEIPIRLGYRFHDLPLPPGRLMYQIGGTSDLDWFVQSGRWAVQDLRAILETHDRTPERLDALLDFGCGAGRVMRHWASLAQSGVALHGTDYNPKMVAWCRRRLPFATFRLNNLHGRLDYPDATFDLAYALSVFTHLDESGQSTWMAELRRVLKPGGLLVITLHGDAYQAGLSPDDAARFGRGDLVVVGATEEGSNDCAAFHPISYVRARMAVGWDLMEHRPAAARGNPVQDYYVLRRPAVATATTARAG